MFDQFYLTDDEKILENKKKISFPIITFTQRRQKYAGWFSLFMKDLFICKILNQDHFISVLDLWDQKYCFSIYHYFFINVGKCMLVDFFFKS